MTGSGFLTIGKITGVHGLAGNLKVWSYADSPDTFKKGRKIMLCDEGNTPEELKTPADPFVIANASARKKGVLLTLKGITTREASEALVGKEILMNREQLPELEEDTWYWEDLIGLDIIDRDLGHIGTVDSLFSTGADDILVVKDAQKTEVLIPMNSHFVEEVSLENKRMTTMLPEGFITEQAK